MSGAGMDGRPPGAHVGERAVAAAHGVAALGLGALSVPGLEMNVGKVEHAKCAARGRQLDGILGF